MASALKQLSDVDREAINHMIRRDAHTDLEIAKEAEVRLGQNLAETDAARIMIVSRYRRGASYKNWLERHHRKDMEMELMKTRFEHLSNLVQGTGDDGFEAVSRSIQARLLTLAAEVSDDELKEAVAGKGWIVNLLKEVRAADADRARSQVSELKRQIAELVSGPHGQKTVNYEALVNKVDEIMGLK